MTEIERDLRVMSSQAEVTLADKFFEELRQTFRCTSWDIFIQLPQYGTCSRANPSGLASS
jgi:hypothetical protein